MNQKLRIFIGIFILIAGLITVTVIRINPNSVTPIQSTETKQAGVVPALGRKIVLNQEIVAVKDYLTGVSLAFTQAGRTNTNENIMLVFDTTYQLLGRQSFSSTRLKEGDFTLVEFDRPLFLGKGKHVILSVLSVNGTEDNAAAPLVNLTDSIGRFFTSVLNPDDLLGSVRNNQTHYRGALMLKTHETNYDQFWLIKIALYVLVVLISAVIIWSDIINRILKEKRIRLEYAYVALAFPFAVVFMIITPPFSVPDEGTHYKLSYSLSELGFLDEKQTYPASIGKMDSSFIFLTFLAGEKLNPDDLYKRFEMKIEPRQRSPLLAVDYKLPYLPQAMGIAIGRIFSSSLLTVMYFGRFFNLLISILIIFFAIRLIPDPFRIILFLLALMPKTIFLFGSLSYDTLTISLSFLTIAVFFHYAYTCQRQITIKDLLVMGSLILLLLLCKPPYFILGALFFIIPPVRFGKLYRYILIGIGVAVIGITVLKIIPMTQGFIEAQNKLAETELTGDLTVPDGPLSAQDSARLSQTLFHPDKQMKNILSDIPGYLELIFKSGFVYFRTYLLKSFVGLLGYIDVELPDMLTYSYLLLILLAALVIHENGIRINIPRRILFAVLLIIAFVLIETAMYLYATRPGRDRVFGVQGRYFIPMAPLFFLLFYNRYINPALNLLLSPRRSEYQQAKPKVKPLVLEEITGHEKIFNKYFYLILMLYCAFALVYSVYLTIIRYYN